MEWTRRIFLFVRFRSERTVSVTIWTIQLNNFIPIQFCWGPNRKLAISATSLVRCAFAQCGGSRSFPYPWSPPFFIFMYHWTALIKTNGACPPTMYLVFVILACSTTQDNCDTFYFSHTNHSIKSAQYNWRKDGSSYISSAYEFSTINPCKCTKIKALIFGSGLLIGYPRAPAN